MAAQQAAALKASEAATISTGMKRSLAVGVGEAGAAPASRQSSLKRSKSFANLNSLDVWGGGGGGSSSGAGSGTPKRRACSVRSPGVDMRGPETYFYPIRKSSTYPLMASANLCGGVVWDDGNCGGETGDLSGESSESEAPCSQDDPGYYCFSSESDGCISDGRDSDDDDESEHAGDNAQRCPNNAYTVLTTMRLSGTTAAVAKKSGCTSRDALPASEQWQHQLLCVPYLPVPKEMLSLCERFDRLAVAGCAMATC